MDIWGMTPNSFYINFQVTRWQMIQRSIFKNQLYSPVTRLVLQVSFFSKNYTYNFANDLPLKIS